MTDYSSKVNVEKAFDEDILSILGDKKLPDKTKEELKELNQRIITAQGNNASAREIFQIALQVGRVVADVAL